ncbi:MAG: hypothetical protein JNK78_19275 [Planctomycetes bacterium]|nr:hypothetical protein [Planctomycetota bacterium]
MRTTNRLVLLSSFTGVVASTTVAQAPVVTVTALSPLVATASAGGASGIEVQPPQVLTSFGSVTAATAFSNGGCAWHSQSSELGGSAIFDQVLFVASGAPTPTSADFGPTEFRIEFSAAAPAPAVLRITRDLVSIPGGAAVPRVLYDLDDDGVLDGDLGAAGDIRLALQFGGQPVGIRIVLESELSIPGSLHQNVAVTLTPWNDLQITPMVTGCLDAPLAFGIHPSFADRGLDIRTVQGPDMLSIGVIGLQAQPVLLPTPMPLPCVLLPSLDILVFDAHIPLPAAVRPVTFFVQGVVIGDPVGITTLPASVVSAF